MPPTIELLAEHGGILLLGTTVLLAMGRILLAVDGVVMETHTRVGRWVKQGDPVCRIVDLQRLRIVGHADATRNTPDDFTNREVTVEVHLGNGHFQCTTGRITFVSPVIETGRRFEVHAEIDNTGKDGHWLFRPGMQATIVLEETPADE